MKRIALTLVVAAVAAVVLADIPRRQEMKHPWAGASMNNQVMLTKLQLLCERASFDEQLAGIEFTDKETGEHIATVTAAKFSPGPSRMRVMIKMTPPDGGELPSDYALRQITATIADMRMHWVKIPARPDWPVLLLIEQDGRGSRGWTYEPNLDREVTTAVRLTPEGD